MVCAGHANFGSEIVPVNGAEVLHVGFVDRLTDVSVAPDSGYLPESPEALLGHAYIFRIPRGSGRFFGVIRLADVDPRGLSFDWAFQTDEGNRELGTSRPDTGVARMSAGTGPAEQAP